MRRILPPPFPPTAEFEWLFAWPVEWLFAIRRRLTRAIPHRLGDRGASALPTSPRPIEVWS